MASRIRRELLLQVISIFPAQSTDGDSSFRIRSRVETATPIHTEQITGNKTVVEITPKENDALLLVKALNESNRPAAPVPSN